jgi:hypothetical protein
MKPITPRERRVLKALINGPLMREYLDYIAGCSNGPELVAGLRRKGLKVPCERVERFDRDGRSCYPGVYRLIPEDRTLVLSLLGGDV